MAGDDIIIAIEAKGEAETIDLARRLAGRLRAGDVIALIGELGAGKTRFVRGLAEGLGLDAAYVTSPTFVLMQEYTTPIAQIAPAAPAATDEANRSARVGVNVNANMNANMNVGADGTQDARCECPLNHVDAFRLSGPDELETIGWDERLEARDAVLAVEWADRILEALPHDHIEIEFEHEADDRRLIRIIPRGRCVDAIEWRAFEAEWKSRAAASSSSSASDAANAAKTCPICGRRVAFDHPSFPFCSKRCRLLDLGRWFAGDYSLSRDMREDDDPDELAR